MENAATGFPGKHFTRYTLICTVAVRYVKPYFLTTQFSAPSAGQCSQQSANEKMKAFPRLNFTISTYYKGTGLEEILKKQEEYLDNADINESDITNI